MHEAHFTMFLKLCLETCVFRSQLLNESLGVRLPPLVKLRDVAFLVESCTVLTSTGTFRIRLALQTRSVLELNLHCRQHTLIFCLLQLRHASCLAAQPALRRETTEDATSAMANCWIAVWICAFTCVNASSPSLSVLLAVDIGQ